MTATCRPEQPTFATGSEQEVWQRLRETLPDGVVLVANLRITDEELDHECDLLVLWPGVGCLALEVKGGQLRYDGDRWRVVTGRHARVVEPVEQVLRVKYAVRDFVEADPRWRAGHVVWAHGVVAPYSSFAPDFSTPACPRWMIHDLGDQADLADRLRTTIERQSRDRAAPTLAEVELIAEVLRGRGFTRDRNDEAAERQAEADRLTTEQATLLKVTRQLHRVEVRGGAGSGKTVLALTQAKQLAAGRGDVPPQRVALLCYSIGLGEYLKRETVAWPHRQRPAFVGTYAELGRSWGAPDGDREDSDFWEHELPRRMAALAADLPDTQRFDAVIVDEAQDFADAWWTPLVGAMKDEEEGGLYTYSDENQRIFARFGQPPVPLVPLVLDHNLRNTRQIYSAFGPLAPTRMTARGGEGIDVGFVPAGADPEQTVDDAVDLLLDVGWFPGNIAVLTTGSRHPVQVREVERHGQAGYWRTYWDADEVFYGHVLGCKGLERPAVVLWVNDSEVRDRAREKLYVGMSRATDQLVVVGDPALVREMGGPAVSRQLGL